MEKKSVGPETPDEVPGVHISLNQLIAYNMARWRKAAGLRQEELGERLGGWSGATVSAAERSWDGRRIRKFRVDELVAIAQALGIPLAAMLLPPEDDGASVRYLFHAQERDPDCSDMADLLALLLPDTRVGPEIEGPWNDALGAAITRYLDAERGAELKTWLEQDDPGPRDRDAELARLRRNREAMLSVLGLLDQVTVAIEREGRS